MPRRNDRTPAPRRNRNGRRHTWPTCPVTGKVRLGEPKDARLALRAAAWARATAATTGTTTSRRETRGYPCTHCKGYHLTSWPTQTTPAVATRAEPPLAA